MTDADGLLDHHGELPVPRATEPGLALSKGETQARMAYQENLGRPLADGDSPDSNRFISVP